MTTQNDDTISSLAPAQQKESVENVRESTKNAQEIIRASDTKANFLGTGGGTLAIAAATLVGSSPDILSDLLKGMLLVSSLFLMAAVVATQIAVYPRTKGMNNTITKEELNKQMLAKNSPTFFEDKYNRLLDECLYLQTHIIPTKNKWIKISILVGWIGVSVLAVTILSWWITLLV
ncbi:hypothetical protein [Shimazuella kribbensis]|uniref:hypothetical protein n=1 Tax=Shimazuella kribbensis TaxID=139808 RepID=UPI000405F974|nr:hypothetical protein [Shimazuella kribbensis]